MHSKDLQKHFTEFRYRIHKFLFTNNNSCKATINLTKTFYLSYVYIILILFQFVSDPGVTERNTQQSKTHQIQKENVSVYMCASVRVSVQFDRRPPKIASKAKSD